MPAKRNNKKNNGYRATRNLGSPLSKRAGKTLNNLKRSKQNRAYIHSERKRKHHTVR